MERIEINDIFKEKEKYLEKEVYLRGWVRNSRFNKNIGFIELSDGSNFENIQLVLENSLENYEEISKVKLYSSVKAKGKLVKGFKEQTVELQVKEIEIEHMSDEKYPLQNKRHTMEFLREIAHLRPRTNIFRAVFKIRSLAATAIHMYMQQEGFIYVNTPLITASDAEGAGELFRVTTLDYNDLPKTKEGEIDSSKDFFGKDSYLTVSGQLNGETFAHAFGKIYTFGPTFRAENSNTVKHAAEFWMIEPEMAFFNLKDNMDFAENTLKFVIDYVLKHGRKEIEFLNKFVSEGLLERLEKDLNDSYARVTYTEAIEKLKESGHSFETKVEWGMDLETEHERYLAETIYKKALFLTDYPKDIKAFYMKENEDKKTVAAMDLLVPGIGELIGGSQREDNLEVLENKVISLGMKPEDYSWYLDLRRYGSVEHSGFGIGFERLIMYITGIKNIRDVIPFPRTPKNCKF